MKIRWEPNPDRYSTGDTAKVGKWRVGMVFMDSLRPVGSPLEWAALSTLPGLKQRLGDYRTEEEAKTRVETAVTHWFRKALEEEQQCESK